MRFCRLAYLTAAIVGIVTCGISASHDPDLVSSENTIVSPAFQDFSEEVIISKVVYDGFTQLSTSTTLVLTQDLKGRLTGEATFSASSSDEEAEDSEEVFTLDVAGEVKLKNGILSFNVRGADGDTTISIDAVRTNFIYPSDDADEEFFSTSTFLADVEFKGASHPYNFEQTFDLTGGNFFSYIEAPEEDIFGLPDRKSSDYYQLFTPWGVALAKGTAVEVGDGVTFTLKAPKFKAVLFDLDGDFEPDAYTLKLSYGKFVGPVLEGD